MAERYKVVDGSQSAHCCFDATVVDTTKPEIIGGIQYVGHNGPQFWAVCECFDREDAERIAAALNATAGVLGTEAPSSDAAWVKRLRDTAKHLRENSLSLAKYPGMADESRARELAALYIQEIADLHEAKRALGVMAAETQQENDLA